MNDPESKQIYTGTKLFLYVFVMGENIPVSRHRNEPKQDTNIHHINKWPLCGTVWTRTHENKFRKAKVLFTNRATRHGKLLRCGKTHVIFRFLIYMYVLYFSEKVQKIERAG